MTTDLPLDLKILQSKFVDLTDSLRSALDRIAVLEHLLKTSNARQDHETSQDKSSLAVKRPLPPSLEPPAKKACVESLGTPSKAHGQATKGHKAVPTQADLDAALKRTLQDPTRPFLPLKSYGTAFKPADVFFLVSTLLKHGQRIHQGSRGRYMPLNILASKHIDSNDRLRIKQKHAGTLGSFCAKASGVANIWLDSRNDILWLADIHVPFRDREANRMFFKNYPSWQPVNPIESAQRKDGQHSLSSDKENDTMNASKKGAENSSTNILSNGTSSSRKATLRNHDKTTSDGAPDQTNRKMTLYTTSNHVLPQCPKATLKDPPGKSDPSLLSRKSDVKRDGIAQMQGVQEKIKRLRDMQDSKRKSVTDKSEALPA